MKAAVLLTTMAALVAGQLIPAPPGLNANIGINPNPNRNFDPASNPGNTAKFTVSTAALPAATGGPSSVDPATAQSMQLAIRNWMSDTTLVSQFLNTGKSIQDDTQFKKMADGAFKAEVDELTNMGVLMKVIGNDPRVSIANQTLLNGVFQMVVDNLQIMSFQGMAKSNLIDTINAGRCPQVLPSIDTYMVVAAEYMQASNISGFQSRAARPDACTQALANVANDATQNPPVPGTPFGNPQGKGDGNIPGLNGLSLTQGGMNNAVLAQSNNTASGSNNAASNSTAGSAANNALPNTTTQQLGLVNFPNNGGGGSPNGNTQNGNTIGSSPPGTNSNSNNGNANPNQNNAKKGNGNGNGKNKRTPFKA